jgi:hypothetical protein
LIPIVKIMGLQAALQKQMYCIVEELLQCVRVFSKDLAIFDLPEKFFGGILRVMYAAKKRVYCLE